jgi:hypothetical protein
MQPKLYKNSRATFGFQMNFQYDNIDYMILCTIVCITSASLFLKFHSYVALR